MRLSKIDYAILIVFVISVAIIVLGIRELRGYFDPEMLLSFDGGFNDPGLFIEHGYPEIRQLASQFRALISSIIVFSITFSEKILGYQQSPRPIQLLLVISWAYFLAALVACGIGLVYNTLALPTALVDQHKIVTGQTFAEYDFYAPAFSSIKILLTGGLFFVAGICSMVGSGIISVLKRK